MAGAPWALVALCAVAAFAFAVWAARDVALKRIRSDERMDALEREMKATEKRMGEALVQAAKNVAGYEERISRLETTKAVLPMAAAQGHRR